MRILFYFFSKLPVYQINTKIKHITKKFILSSFCGKILAIDLISVDNISEFNKGYNYIFTTIDFFSRNFWARPLKNKEVSTI